MKKCNKCKENKDLKEFSKNKSSPDGLQKYCKQCVKLVNKKYYQNGGKKVIRARSEEYRKRNKEFVLDFLSKHPCVDCGNRDIEVLEFDHIRDKEYNVSNMVHSFMSIEKIKDEISKCEVRCANCHRKKTIKQFGWNILGL